MTHAGKLFAATPPQKSKLAQPPKPFTQQNSGKDSSVYKDGVGIWITHPITYLSTSLPHTHARAVGSKNVVVRLIDYHNERTTGVSVESYKNLLQTVQELHWLDEKPLLRMRTKNFDDLYLKIDQKVVRPWPDQPDQLLRPCMHKG